MLNFLNRRHTINDNNHFLFPFCRNKMLSKIVFVLALTTLAHADDFSLQEEEFYGEPRLLDGLMNNTSIDGNAILALLLIGILFLVTNGGTGGLFGGSAYNRNSYGQYDYADYGYGQDQFYKRQGHFDNGK